MKAIADMAKGAVTEVALKVIPVTFGSSTAVPPAHYEVAAFSLQGRTDARQNFWSQSMES